MSTYKEIKGTTVQDLDSDPTNQLGDVFYNSTSNTLKAFNLGSASWTSSGNLGTARAGGAGSKNGAFNAVVHFGGYTPPGANAVNNTEHYDGSSWTGATSLPTAIRNCAGCGTQTAALSIGGVGNPGEALEYNGSSWSDGGNMSGISNCPGQSFGTQTAALAFDAEESEEYDGSSWTSGGTPGRGKIQGNCAGTQTAGIAYGGEPGQVTTAEFYNGTSWTTAPSMNTGKQNQAGFGIQTNAVSAGGPPPPNGTNTCEIYNGTSWSTTANMNTARGQVEGAGVVANGMICGGWVGSPTNATENFTGPAPATVTIDTD